MWPASVALLGSLVLLAIIVRRFIRNRIDRKGHPLPPGPTSLPLVGSVFSIDIRKPYLTFTKWRKVYGDIIYFQVMNIDTIVLNSPSDAMELLGKRSAIYSDRPFLAFVEAYGQGFNFAFSQYGDHWRLCRRIFHETFRAQVSNAFRPMQLRRAHEMILNIIDDPEEYPSHYSTFASAVAMSSVYDYDVKPQNDPILSAGKHFLQFTASLLAPGKGILIQVFPFLLYIPEWLPGPNIRRETKEIQEMAKKVIEIPYQHVRRRMERKENINDSMVFNNIIHMQSLDKLRRSEYETALKHASTTAFLGAVETTLITTMVFTLAMVKNPRVWKRAQREIDDVVGMNRLPQLEDRNSLPYVEAVIRETLRWKPAFPAAPHATTHSDIYNGYYIPKGATVIFNIWAMCYDDVRYPNPDVFYPERFLDAQGHLIDDNPADFVFGFGRRSCPGRHVADGSIWSAIVTMLATLEFNLLKDKDGNDVIFEPEFRDGPVLYLNKFPCRFTLRTHVSKEALGWIPT